MPFRIVIKPIVITDAEEAVNYYNKQSGELGKRFYNEFLTSLSDIEAKPFTFSYISEPVRRYKMKKFPYKIYYMLTDEAIIILGLAHAKRSNTFVKRRLKL